MSTDHRARTPPTPAGVTISAEIPHLFFHELGLALLLGIIDEVARGEPLFLASPLEFRNVVHEHTRLELLPVMEARLIHQDIGNK